MSRLGRKVVKLDFDSIALSSGWHRGNIYPQSRSVTYYKGPSYVAINFTPWLLDVASVRWWDAKTDRLNIFDRHDGDIFMGTLISDIFEGKIDPKDKEAILRYILV